MKKIRNSIVFLTAGVVLFVACQSKREKLNAQIAEAEKQLAVSYTEDVTNRLVVLYQEYAKAYPQDSLAVEYLFRAADCNMKLKKGTEALANLDAIIGNYPDNRRVPECYFFKGFVYEDVLYDMEAAKKAYYEFVGMFPSHALALDASICIAYLERGMSTDEIVASFKDSTSDIVK